MKNHVYVLERGQHFEYSHYEWEVIAVYDDCKLAEQYIKKHKDDEIPESEQNPDFEYDHCTYEYQVKRLKIINEVKKDG